MFDEMRAVLDEIRVVSLVVSLVVLRGRSEFGFDCRGWDSLESCRKGVCRLEALPGPEAHRVKREYFMFLQRVCAVFVLDLLLLAGFGLKAFGERFGLDIAPRWWTLRRLCVMFAGKMHFIILPRMGQCASACPCCLGEILTTTCFCMPAQESVCCACNFGWAEALT